MQHINNKKEIIIQKLKKTNLKITPQRVAILNELINNFNHPTTNDVYQIIKKKLPNISFDTVNRTLLTFVRNNIIKTTEGQNGNKRYDSTIEPHHHFHCIICNKIIDFINKEYDKIQLPISIAKKHQILSQKIILDGICQNCKKNKKIFKLK